MFEVEPWMWLIPVAMLAAGVAFGAAPWTPPCSCPPRRERIVTEPTEKDDRPSSACVMSFDAPKRYGAQAHSLPAHYVVDPEVTP